MANDSGADGLLELRELHSEDSEDKENKKSISSIESGDDDEQNCVNRSDNNDNLSIPSVANSEPEDDDQPEHSAQSIALSSAIETGNLEGVIDWLADCVPAEKAKKLNSIKFSFWSRTPLHLAALYNYPKIVKLLLTEGADPNVRDSDGDTVLHLALSNSSDEDVTELVETILERDCDVNVTNESKATPLHRAAYNGHSAAVKLLLDKNANLELKDYDEDQAIHIAASEGHYEVAEILLIANPECVKWQGGYGQTPLHKACEDNSIDNSRMVKLFVENGADVNAKDDNEDTPLLLASEDQSSANIVKILLENGAEANPSGDQKEGPLQKACYWGCNESVSLLLKHGAKVDFTALKDAISEGYEEIVRQIIDVPQWPSLLRHTFNESSSRNVTTPFREMIRKMPNVAEEILHKCTVSDPSYENADDNSYSVVFNYEFIEDTRDDDKEGVTDDETDSSSKKKAKDQPKYGCSYEEIEGRPHHNYSTSWGPKGFTKSNHPFAIMVESKRLNLLTHPLVGSLLHHKWQKFGQYGYFINLFTYCIFLTFLTVFALIVKNPQNLSCTTFNSTGMNIDCGINTARLAFIYISAVVVLCLSLGRLILEAIQLISQFSKYIFDWINWMEVALFACSFIFVWVFHFDCLCPRNWQWQIGVVAVFLGWIDLIVFISKFPLTGIYVLMFVKILYTFLRMLTLSILLVVAFGLTFYLAFTEPTITRSPFSNPARSLLKTMTMTTGEFDFDSIFRQDPSGENDDAEEIPFPPISYILWVVFVIIMPILLTNMLVGLAVGDIQAIQDEAALQKLALQVEQVLTVEELLPRKLRRRFITGYKEVYPNHPVSWRKKLKFIVWGGERYDTRGSIGRVLHPHEGENEKIQKRTDKIINEVEGLKASVREIQQQLQPITEIQKQLVLILNKLEGKKEDTDNVETAM